MSARYPKCFAKHCEINLKILLYYTNKKSQALLIGKQKKHLCRYINTKLITYNILALHFFYEMVTRQGPIQCSEMKIAIFVLQMCNEMEFFGALTQSKVKRAKGLSLKKKTTQ